MPLDQNLTVFAEGSDEIRNWGREGASLAEWPGLTFLVEVTLTVASCQPVLLFLVECLGLLRPIQLRWSGVEPGHYPNRRRWDVSKSDAIIV